MSLEWRVVKLEQQDGCFNTLLDEVLLENATPTIAFTSWNPTVSIGRNQSYTLDIDEEACKRHGVCTVRRRSGGQAVYLDNDYIVVSAVAPPKVLTSDVKKLSRDFAKVIIETLQGLGIKAEFSEPTDVILREENIKQIGNCANFISNRGIFVHGSIRYALNSFDKMIDVLKVNGHKLQEYRRDIQKVLTSVTDYKKVARESVISIFLENFIKQFGGKSTNGLLTEKEINKIRSLITEDYKQSWLKDKDSYISKGICYLDLNGKNLVPAMDQILYKKEVIACPR